MIRIEREHRFAIPLEAGFRVHHRPGQLAGDYPVVTMATAHPAKFPEAVERATGVRPVLPDHLADLFDRPERTELVANDLAVVEDYVAGTFDH